MQHLMLSRICDTIAYYRGKKPGKFKKQTVEVSIYFTKAESMVSDLVKSMRRLRQYNLVSWSSEFSILMTSAYVPSTFPTNSCSKKVEGVKRKRKNSRTIWFGQVFSYHFIFTIIFYFTITLLPRSSLRHRAVISAREWTITHILSSPNRVINLLYRDRMLSW